jgi:transcriptional antiterminator RfaH
MLAKLELPPTNHVAPDPPAVDGAAAWYLVRTKPHAETKTECSIKDKGFLTYLPVCRKTRRHARKVEQVKAPLFPQYLFVAIDWQDRHWRFIDREIGGASLVRNGNEPAPVPLAVIKALKDREVDGGYIKLDEPTSRFAPGDRVRVVDGVFAEHVGLFVDEANQRVAVLLSMWGRKVRVELNEGAIAAA